MPVKLARVPDTNPMVLIPGALIPVAIPARVTLPALTEPNVENPVTFKLCAEQIQVC